MGWVAVEMFKQKLKDIYKISGYNKDKKETQFNYKKIVVALVVVVAIFAAIGIGAVLLKTKHTDNNSAATTDNKPCSALTTEDNKTENLAPWSPIVKSKLNGKFNATEKICVWRVNGKETNRTYPEGEYCVKAGMNFYNVGKTQIDLSVVGLTCNETIVLNVTGKSDQQKQADLQEKLSGETAEDIKLNQDYEASKNKN